MIRKWLRELWQRPTWPQRKTSEALCKTNIEAIQISEKEISSQYFTKTKEKQELSNIVSAPTP